MNALVQPFPALDSATEAALRASIERFGVLVPVVQDQYGRTLDGHHRSRIADGLGVEYRVDVRETADEDEAREIARTLNEDRRQLPRDQRREIVKALREEGHSFRAIGRALGVDHTTAIKDVRESSGDNPPVAEPERIVGLDGKSRPATRPKQTRRTPLGRRSNTEPFVADNKRRRDIANGQRARLIEGISQINGICRGLRDLDYGMVAAVVEADELGVWAAKAEELARTLRDIKSKLMEVSDAR